MRVVWTKPAIEDLRNLRTYIATDSDLYAQSFVERIILAAERLSSFPLSGRKVPELGKTRYENSYIINIA